MISEKRSSAVAQRIATKEVANKTNVRQILEYAGTVMDPHIQQDIDKLKAVQRRAARFVLRCFHNTLSVSDVLKRLQWPSLEQRRRIACLLMLYKVQNSLVCLDDITRQRHGHDQQFVLLQCHQQCHKMFMSFLPRTIAH